MHSWGLKTLLIGCWKVIKKKKTHKPSTIWLIFVIQRSMPKPEILQEPQTELSNADWFKFLPTKPNSFAEIHKMCFQPHRSHFWPFCHTPLLTEHLISLTRSYSLFFFEDRSFLYPLYAQKFPHQYYQSLGKNECPIKLFCLQGSKCKLEAQAPWV